MQQRDCGRDPPARRLDCARLVYTPLAACLPLSSAAAPRSAARRPAARRSFYAPNVAAANSRQISSASSPALRISTRVCLQVCASATMGDCRREKLAQAATSKNARARNVRAAAHWRDVSKPKKVGCAATKLDGLSPSTCDGRRSPHRRQLCSCGERRDAPAAFSTSSRSIQGGGRSKKTTKDFANFRVQNRTSRFDQAARLLANVVGHKQTKATRKTCATFVAIRSARELANCVALATSGGAEKVSS